MRNGKVRPVPPRAGGERRNGTAEGHRRYSRTFVTTPEPTVLPPSRMAKRRPGSMATGLSGDNVTMTVELPPDKPVAMEPGLRFAIREGGKTVGSGVVTKVLE